MADHAARPPPAGAVALTDSKANRCRSPRVGAPRSVRLHRQFCAAFSPLGRPVHASNKCIMNTATGQPNSDFYREQAAKYRSFADMAKDAAAKQELLKLAAACEGIADKIDDLQASEKTATAPDK
jgi:hypothetical protein